MNKNPYILVIWHWKQQPCQHYQLCTVISKAKRVNSDDLADTHVTGWTKWVLLENGRTEGNLMNALLDSSPNGENRNEISRNWEIIRFHEFNQYMDELVLKISKISSSLKIYWQILNYYTAHLQGTHPSMSGSSLQSMCTQTSADRVT